MSITTSGSRPRSAKQDMVDGARPGVGKCRIPQRFPNNRSRQPSMSVSAGKYNTFNCAHNTEKIKSPSKLQEELFPSHFSRHPRHTERTTLKKRPTSSFLNRMSMDHKTGRSAVIVVPNPPSQMIEQRENLELRQSEVSGNGTSPDRLDSLDKESITSNTENLMRLKINWQEKAVEFEKMKLDLNEKQKKILEVYALMHDTHHKMCLLGENTDLPSPEELRIMNVAKMTPNQLLKLCSGGDTDKIRNNTNSKEILSIDVNKLYEKPVKLIDTCEESFAKRKEFMDWFESLKSEGKGISWHTLSKRINEFRAENDMLKSTLDQAKAEFLRELEQIVQLLRKGANDTMALQLRIEVMSSEISELNTQNAALRKKKQIVDAPKSYLNHTDKSRVEIIEKELKEERIKKTLLRDRLIASDGLLKTSVEQATQLEATLEQARAQIWSLELKVQQLREQNDKLQSGHQEKFNTLTDSIKEHTMNLEEIARARDKLKEEKEDLEQNLKELSKHYDESLKVTKLEMHANVAKLIENEKKYDELLEEKQKLEKNFKSVCNKLCEMEAVYGDKLRDKEIQLENQKELNKELEDVRHELEIAAMKIYEYTERSSKQNKAIKELEENLEEAIQTTESLKSDLTAKNMYISDLETRQATVEQQLKDNENKMELYVQQLSTLKEHITQLQKDFGEFENLNALLDMINDQREKLLEVAREKEQLTEELQKKDKKLEEYNESVSHHERLLLEREGLIKMLSEKDEEQNNIIKILRNNIELRSQVDNDMGQQLIEKDMEIESLLNNLETRKQQISNMEKIILTLEEQAKKVHLQRKKDQELVILLQKKIADSEDLRMASARNSPVKELSSLIQILEDELDTPNANHKDQGRKKPFGDNKRNNSQHCYQYAHDSCYPTVDFEILKKMTYISESGNNQQFGDLDRKKAITSIDVQKGMAAKEPVDYNVPKLTTNHLKSIRRLTTTPLHKPSLPRFHSHLQDDKKSKMLKLAGHKL